MLSWWDQYGLWIWRAYASCCGILFVSLGIGFTLVAIFAGKGPVLRPIGDIDHPTTVVKRFGEIHYRIDVQRLESCPGDLELVLQWSPQKQTPPQSVSIPSTVVSIERPTMPVNFNPGIRPADVVLVLPPSVFPGKWTYTAGVESHCPTRKQFDLLTKFDFQVID